ncbi:MAG: hypothetical protein OIF40_05505 [Mangrovicoccus sp.]|nr:hypothetical protein [Mangrovicoccus sp.]
MNQQEYLNQFELNQIKITRTRLTFDEAVAVWHMHWDENFNSLIAAKFGVNQGRIAEILNEKAHIGSRERAFQLRSG